LASFVVSNSRGVDSKGFFGFVWQKKISPLARGAVPLRAA
jgi:hypothetical protein